MRYFVGFLVTIGLICLIIFLLITGGHKSNATPKVLNLDSYAYSDTTTAEYIVDGPIQANQTHNTVKIDVTQASVVATVYQGYDQTVLRQQTYANNDQSFAVFMHALQLAQFQKGNDSQALQDERGYCPSGQRYIYALNNAQSQLARHWTTTCGQGTFKGSQNTVSYLFRSLIPSADSSALLSNVNVTL